MSTTTETIQVKLEWNNTFVRNFSICDFCGENIYWKDSTAWGEFAHPGHGDIDRPTRGGGGDVCLRCLARGAMASQSLLASRVDVRGAVPPDNGSVTTARMLAGYWASVADSRFAETLLHYTFEFALSPEELTWVKHSIGDSHDGDGEYGGCAECGRLQLAADPSQGVDPPEVDIPF